MYTRRRFLNRVAALGTGALVIPGRALVRAAPATYYIDAVEGSDANSGRSPAAAWQTIAQANAVGLWPGDTLLLRGDQTHRGNLVLDSLATTHDTRITIGSYGTERATINPSNSYGIKVKDTGFVTIQDLIVSGPGVSLSGMFPNRTGATTSTEAGIYVEVTTPSTWHEGIVIDTCDVTGCLRGIDFRSTVPSSSTVAHKNAQITKCTVEACGTHGFITHGTGSTASQIHGVGILYDNFTFTSCKASRIYGITSWGGWDGGNGGSARQNGFGFVLGNARNSLVYRCYATMCGEASPSGARGGPTGFMPFYSDAVTIRECECDTVRAPEGVDGFGFEPDIGCRNCIIERCVARNCDGPGLGSYNATDTTFRFNIVENCGRIAKAGAWCEGTRDVMIHNTIYHDKASNGPAHAVVLGGSSGSLINNIISAGNGAAFGRLDGNPKALGNCYHVRPGSAFSLTVNGMTYTRLEDVPDYEILRANYGLTADPLFVAAGGATTQWPTTGTSTTLTAYDLQPGSPCINVGYDPHKARIDPGTVDFHNRTLVGKARTRYTIGAVLAMLSS